MEREFGQVEFTISLEHAVLMVDSVLPTERISKLSVYRLYNWVVIGPRSHEVHAVRSNASPMESSPNPASPKAAHSFDVWIDIDLLRIWHVSNREETT